MNTTKIYSAQLNVSEFYTVETINNLINKLSYLGKDVYYNTETRSIDIELEDPKTAQVDTETVRKELKEWIKELPADKESIYIICDNINIVFNITNITVDNISIIKLYLY